MSKKLLTDKRRVYLGGAVKSIDAEKRTIRAYASTSAWDRYEERFEPDAFKDGLGNYKKNPVVLWAHDYSQAPIGKTIGYEFDEKGLILTMEFADTEEAKKVFALYEGGFMNAFSVGFRPLEVAYEERTPGGRMGVVYKRAELLENSAVPVPANPEACVMKGIGGKTQEVPGELLRGFLEAGFDVRERIPRPGDIVPAEPGDESGIEQTTEPEHAKTLTKEGDAPDLKTTLDYLLGLAKMVRAKGKKVEDEDVRGLLIQACNLFRELIYGPGSQKLQDEQQPLTAEQKTALVAEYQALVDALPADASEEYRAELVKLAEAIEKEISRE